MATKSLSEYCTDGYWHVKCDLRPRGLILARRYANGRLFRVKV